MVESVKWKDTTYQFEALYKSILMGGEYIPINCILVFKNRIRIFFF